MNEALECLVTEVPGPRTAELAARLRAHESRNVTFIAADFPVFWESADGATVTDVDGNRYLDATAAFGVANAGHCNPRVADAVARQVRQLVHGMGDVHPSQIRVQLLERLAQILPCSLDRVFLATTGSEAVEAALKSAILHTGKSRFAAYHGAYHGLSFGALAVGGIERFREPFAGALGAPAMLLDYPSERTTSARDAIDGVRRAFSVRDDLAAVIIEPIQGRGGVIVPPRGYLQALRVLCDERRIVMIVNEIFTGFGRTGAWFAVNRESVVPDILCIGKAMGSGLPISAAAGRAGDHELVAGIERRGAAHLDVSRESARVRRGDRNDRRARTSRPSGKGETCRINARAAFAAAALAFERGQRSRHRDALRHRALRRRASRGGRQIGAAQRADPVAIRTGRRRHHHLTAAGHHATATGARTEILERAIMETERSTA